MYHSRARGGKARIWRQAWLCYCGIVHGGRVPACQLCDDLLACPAWRAIDLGPTGPATLQLCVRCDSLPGPVQRAKYFARHVKLKA